MIALILLLSLTSHVAVAQSEIARIIPAQSNPLFLRFFADRFSEGFRARTSFTPAMPERLHLVWQENMAEPRDFAEEIVPSVIWPRFQWGIGSQSHPHRTYGIYQWFDRQNPERLSRAWNRAFCLEKEKNYVGVAWAQDLSKVDFFFRDGRRLRVRRYENKIFTREYFLDFTVHNGQVTGQATHKGQLLYTLNPVSRVAPRLKNAQAAHLQFAIEREFLISPRFFIRDQQGAEAVYFP